MTSQRRIAANQKNARQSTGPKTAKGKAASRMNALKHGLTAADVLLPDEDAAEFEELTQRLKGEFEPAGEIERVLVEQIATCIWRRCRLLRIERDILHAGQLGYELERLRDLAQMHKFEEPLWSGIRYRFLTSEDETAHDKAMSQYRETQVKLALAKVGLGKAFKRGIIGADPLGKLSRYETSIERSLYRALETLLRVQAARRAKTDQTEAKTIDVDLKIEN